jgi:aspartate aminotransferase
MVRLAGGTPVEVACPEADGFKIGPERLDAAITARTKWLMLNSPANPTGAVYSAVELAALGDVLRRHPSVHVLSDDIYEKLVYDSARFATIAEVAPDLKARTLLVNGVSKTNAMTGWRVGYGAGPIALIQAMNVVQGQTSSHTSSISQHAAVEAIGGDQSYVADFVRQFQARRDLVLARLGQVQGLRCSVPDGAFYVFPSIEGLIGARKPDGGSISSDVDFAHYLLDQAGVAVVPGSGFMASPYIRISYASALADLERACERIRVACQALSLRGTP